MRGGRIYLLDEEGELEPMVEAEYEAEVLLQRLLGEHPDLLAGDQMTEREPRRWLLVRREMGVPDVEAGGGRWSLDHLFLDQDGVPTLVEVKRSSDTRSRREVVAQMLDYAANGVVYWPADQIEDEFIARCEAAGLDVGQVLAEHVGGADASEEFWQRVKTNLRAGRIRMVFVADEIPSELLRIVEFLNEQMDPAEVLAVEVKQFVGSNRKTLVPRVLGQTVEAQTRKAVTRRTRSWDLESMLEDLERREGSAAVEVAKRLYDWASGRRMPIDWGSGAHHGSFAVRALIGGERYPTFGVSSEGHVEIGFPMLRGRPPFDSPNVSQRLVDRLEAIPTVSLPADAIDRWPRIPLSDLSGHLAEFCEVWEWFEEQVRD